MFETNEEIFLQCSEGFLSCIKKLLYLNIAFVFNPLSLEHSPYGFCNIQAWRVRREIEQEKNSLLPEWSSLLKAFGTMNAGLVQYKECLFAYFQGEVFQKFHNFLSIHIFFRAKLKKFTLPVYYGKAIHPADILESIQTCILEIVNRKEYTSPYTHAIYPHSTNQFCRNP